MGPYRAVQGRRRERSVGDPSVRGTPAPVRAVLLVAIGVLWLMCCVAFVVSEEARWLTGQNIHADGGVVM